jgi:hypothetical protein
MPPDAMLARSALHRLAVSSTRRFARPEQPPSFRERIDASGIDGRGRWQ